MTESRSFEDVYKAQTERIAQLEHELAALRERLAQPEQEPWIKCSERLPENKRAVLVFSPSNRCIFCAYLNVGIWWYFGDNHEQIIRSVTHWRPLPHLPTGDEK